MEKPKAEVKYPEAISTNLQIRVKAHIPNQENYVTHQLFQTVLLTMFKTSPRHQIKSVYSQRHPPNHQGFGYYFALVWGDFFLAFSGFTLGFDGYLLI